MVYLWIGIGSALGGMARHWMATAVTARLGEGFPWGTILVNVSGSFLIGFFATIATADGRLLLPPDARYFVMAGLCGGYTTFSAFSLQTLQLVQEGEVAAAGANVGLSVVLCLAAVWLGHISARWLNLSGA